MEEDDQGGSRSRFAVDAGLFPVLVVSDHEPRCYNGGSGQRDRFGVSFQKQFDRYYFKNPSASRKMRLLYTLHVRLGFVSVELAYLLCDSTKQSLICHGKPSPPAPQLFSIVIFPPTL